MNRYVFFVLFLISFFISFGQTQIKGKIQDGMSQKPLSNAIVSLYNENTNKIIEYTQSNNLGEFYLLKGYTIGVYRLEVSKLGFQKEKKQIVIGTDEKKSIDVDFFLGQKEIQEVVITKKNPIIVKKDTIIYDIGHFTEKHNETLEEVLAKIAGIKITPTGDIEVEGKIVKKVLLDGKEVSDFGAAIITKSLSPDKVKNVEVRFDEKNNKLKESLLDGDKFVVLDISLKENAKKSFFGKQRLTLGNQNKFQLGGLSNLFSLNSKFNIQFFAENNNFGHNEIKLHQIKNIGEDAFYQIFSLPKDIDDIRNSENYHNEMYGFRNYTANDNAIIGLSMNLPLGKNADIYIGSFNNYHFLRNDFRQQTFFNENKIYDIEENNLKNDYNSKNKIQIKYTSDKFKLISDINYVYSDKKIGNNISDLYFHRFKKNSFESNWYFNNILEYTLMKKIGVYSKISVAQERYNHYFHFYTEDQNLYSFLGISEDFLQENRNLQTLVNSKLGLTYKTEKLGVHSMGVRSYFNHLENEKISNASLFNVTKNTYKSNAHTIFYDNSIYWGNFYLKTDLGYSFVYFPRLERGKYLEKNKGYFNYKFNGEYTLRKSKFKVSSFKQVDNFPLSKLVLGNILMDYQTIYFTNSNIEPFYNTIYEASFFKELKNKTDFSIAYVRGISQNLNNQSLSNKFIIVEANQLNNKYHLFSVNYGGKLKSMNLGYILEPEFIINTSEYINSGNVEHTTAHRYLVGLKLLYSPKNKKFSFFYYPKYSHFIFSNTISNKASEFNFLSNKIEAKFYFLKQKLMAEMGYRQVNFFQTKNSFNNLDVNLVYKTDRYKWFLGIGNMLNSKSFILKDFNQSLLNEIRNGVFPRYINLGFEMKIN